MEIQPSLGSDGRRAFAGAAPVVLIPGGPDFNRRELRLLDTCLQELEDASERGEAVVSAGLAGRLRAYVRDVVFGMPISDALNLVFREQELYLSGPGRVESMPGEPDGAGSLIDRAEARSLTERIKTEMREVSLLLLEAHERRAWAALGYRTWDQYVRREFGLSRSRSYELLDHGRVIQTIRAATGMSVLPAISAYAAAQIKARLDEVVEEIRDRMQTAASPRQIGEIVEAVVRAHRGQPTPAPGPGVEPREEADFPTAGIDLDRLETVVDYLATLPPAHLIVQAVLEDRRHETGRLRRAADWLNELVEQCDARRSVALRL